MRKEQRWRYYCDFCQKAGGSGGHIAKHEKSCTANPDRSCSYCRYAGPVADLTAVLASRGTDWHAGMDALRAVTNGCPGCILAATRQSYGRLDVSTEDAWWDDGGGNERKFGFNFQKEKAIWWSNHPRVEAEAPGSDGVRDAAEFLAKSLSAAGLNTTADELLARMAGPLN